jgi:hypothetical protein
MHFESRSIDFSTSRPHHGDCEGRRQPRSRSRACEAYRGCRNRLRYRLQAFAANEQALPRAETRRGPKVQRADAAGESNLRFTTFCACGAFSGVCQGRMTRVQPLCKMKSVVAPGGAAFSDVNNWHNARTYARMRIKLRVALDATWPDELRGDATLKWKSGGQCIAATGHLFALAKFANSIRARAPERN